jgi:1,4-dihydroxy-2-naphthoyl-CoA hydrolase
MDFKGHLDFTITEQAPERVRGVMPVQAGLLNPFGVVHAGAMLWFADVCATILAAGTTDTTRGGAGFPLGVSLHANLVANQRDGQLQATSVFVKRGRTLSVVRTTITGDGDRLLADVTTSHVPAQPKATLGDR